MPDIDNLNMPGEEIVGTIDESAPEAGSFQPQVAPGEYEATFKLADDPFSTQTVDGKPYLQVTHSAIIHDNGEDKEVTYQRASWYKSEKMTNSFAAELTRALGIKLEGAVTGARWKQALEHADGRSRFRAEYIWEFYCRNCGQTTVSTRPRKKAGQQPWPRQSDGSPVPAISCPVCKGPKGYGQVRISRYLLPAHGATQVHTSTTQAKPNGSVGEDTIPQL